MQIKKRWVLMAKSIFKGIMQSSPSCLSLAHSAGGGLDCQSPMESWQLQLRARLHKSRIYLHASAGGLDCLSSMDWLMAGNINREHIQEQSILIQDLPLEDAATMRSKILCARGRCVLQPICDLLTKFCCAKCPKSGVETYDLEGGSAVNKKNGQENSSRVPLGHFRGQSAVNVKNEEENLSRLPLVGRELIKVLKPGEDFFGCQWMVPSTYLIYQDGVHASPCKSSTTYQTRDWVCTDVPATFGQQYPAAAVWAYVKTGSGVIVPLSWTISEIKKQLDKQDICIQGLKVAISENKPSTFEKNMSDIAAFTFGFSPSTMLGLVIAISVVVPKRLGVTLEDMERIVGPLVRLVDSMDETHVELMLELLLVLGQF